MQIMHQQIKGMMQSYGHFHFLFNETSGKGPIVNSLKIPVQISFNERTRQGRQTHHTNQPILGYLP